MSSGPGPGYSRWLPSCDPLRWGVRGHRRFIRTALQRVAGLGVYLRAAVGGGRHLAEVDALLFPLHLSTGRVRQEDFL